MNANCSTCVFWQDLGIYQDDRRVGECRLNSPTMVEGDYSDPPEFEGQGPTRRALRVWPETYEDDWCGDVTIAVDKKSEDAPEDAA